MNETKDRKMNLKRKRQGQKCDKRTTQQGCQSEREDTAKKMRRDGAESVSENQLSGECLPAPLTFWMDQQLAFAHSHTDHPAI